MPARPKTSRLAWALTGSGHYLRECLALARQLDNIDLYLSGAAAEVLNMYGYRLDELRNEIRIFRDQTDCGAPVGLFYEGHYHAVVVAPATSNTVAKCVWGISDTLVTNIFAQAGKCRIPSVVFACDTAPELESESPRRTVNVYPRQVDLLNIERLREFESTQVVNDIAQLRQAIEGMHPCLNASSF
jgi:flavoprotein